MAVAAAVACLSAADHRAFANEPDDAATAIKPVEFPELDALKRRSAEERWQRIHTDWQSSDAAGEPIASPASRPLPALPDTGGSPADRPFEPRRSPDDAGFRDAEPIRPVEDPISNRPSGGQPGMPRALPSAAPFPRTINARRLGHARQLPPEPSGDTDDPTSVPPTAAYSLGRIHTVMPYADYEPDSVVNSNDPCFNQCPRPEDCKDVDPSLGPSQCPPIVQLSDAPFEGRLFAEGLFTWEAPDLWYNPLYFEDVPLERYGHTCKCEIVQPLVSAGKFSAHLLALPYQMSIDPLCSRRYPLGHYRPGECAPKLCYQPPLNLDVAAATAAFYTGMFYIFP